MKRNENKRRKDEENEEEEDDDDDDDDEGDGEEGGEEKPLGTALTTALDPSKNGVPRSESFLSLSLSLSTSLVVSLSLFMPSLFFLISFDSTREKKLIVFAVHKWTKERAVHLIPVVEPFLSRSDGASPEFQDKKKKRNEKSLALIDYDDDDDYYYSYYYYYDCVTLSHKLFTRLCACSVSAPESSGTRWNDKQPTNTRGGCVLQKRTSSSSISWPRLFSSIECGCRSTTRERSLPAYEPVPKYFSLYWIDLYDEIID